MPVKMYFLLLISLKRIVANVGHVKIFYVENNTLLIFSNIVYSPLIFYTLLELATILLSVHKVIIYQRPH